MADSLEIKVRVKPDTSNFISDLKSAVAKKPVEVDIKATPASINKIAESLKGQIETLNANKKNILNINVKADTANLISEIEGALNSHTFNIKTTAPSEGATVAGKSGGTTVNGVAIVNKSATKSSGGVVATQAKATQQNNTQISKLATQLEAAANYQTNRNVKYKNDKGELVDTTYFTNLKQELNNYATQFSDAMSSGGKVSQEAITGAQNILKSFNQVSEALNPDKLNQIGINQYNQAEKRFNTAKRNTIINDRYSSVMNGHLQDINNTYNGKGDFILPSNATTKSEFLYGINGGATRHTTDTILDNAAVTRADNAKLLSVMKGSAKVSSTSADFYSYISQNSKWKYDLTAKQRVSSLKSMLSSAQSGDYQEVQFQRLKDELGGLKSYMANAGLESKNLLANLKSIASTQISQGLVAAGVGVLTSSIKDAIDNVKTLDKELTNIKIITNDTSGYDTFLSKAFEQSKATGANAEDVLNSTATYARLGYTKEQALGLATNTGVYSKVADVEETAATDSITSTLKAFNIDATKSIDIVDKFTAVGNNYAISASGIGEALQRSAAAMSAANNSMDETIALATAANTTVQNPETVGTALKTLSARIRGSKAELADMGEEVNGVFTSSSKLQNEIMSLTGGKVDIMSDPSTYKSTYQILKEISKVWGDLSDINKATILEDLGGKRQANVIAGIINGFKTAEDALKTAQNSSGTAMEANEKRLDSISGKTEQFKTSFQEMSTSVIDSGLVKFFVDLGTSTLSAFNSVSNTIGAIPTLLGTAALGDFASQFVKAGRLKGATGHRGEALTVDVLSEAVKGKTSNGYIVNNGKLEDVTSAGGILDDQMDQTASNFFYGLSNKQSKTMSRALAYDFTNKHRVDPLTGVRMNISRAEQLRQAQSYFQAMAAGNSASKLVLDNNVIGGLGGTLVGLDSDKLAKGGLTFAEQVELLTKNALGTKHGVNTKDYSGLVKAMSDNGASEAINAANAKLIASGEEVPAALAKSADSVTSYGSGIKAQFKSIAALITAHPIASSIVAGAAIAGVGIYAYIKHLDNLHKRAQETFEIDTEKYNKSKTQLETLKSLQEKLVAARGDKQALFDIQEDLNSAIGETKGLTNGEAGAYVSSTKRLRTAISAKEKEVDTNKAAATRSGKESYDSIRIGGFVHALEGGGDSSRTVQDAGKTVSSLTKIFSNDKNMNAFLDGDNEHFVGMVDDFSNRVSDLTATLELTMQNIEDGWNDMSKSEQKNAILEALKSGEFENALIGSNNTDKYRQERSESALSLYKKDIDEYKGNFDLSALLSTAASGDSLSSDRLESLISIIETGIGGDGHDWKVNSDYQTLDEAINAYTKETDTDKKSALGEDLGDAFDRLIKAYNDSGANDLANTLANYKDELLSNQTQVETASASVTAAIAQNKVKGNKDTKATVTEYISGLSDEKLDIASSLLNTSMGEQLSSLDELEHKVNIIDEYKSKIDDVAEAYDNANAAASNFSSQLSSDKSNEYNAAYNTYEEAIKTIDAGIVARETNSKEFRTAMKYLTGSADTSVSNYNKNKGQYKKMFTTTGWGNDGNNMLYMGYNDRDQLKKEGFKGKISKNKDGSVKWELGSGEERKDNVDVLAKHWHTTADAINAATEAAKMYDKSQDNTRNVKTNQNFLQNMETMKKLTVGQGKNAKTFNLINTKKSVEALEQLGFSATDAQEAVDKLVKSSDKNIAVSVDDNIEEEIIKLGKLDKSIYSNTTDKNGTKKVSLDVNGLTNYYDAAGLSADEQVKKFEKWYTYLSDLPKSTEFSVKIGNETFTNIADIKTAMDKLKEDLSTQQDNELTKGLKGTSTAAKEAKDAVNGVQIAVDTLNGSTATVTVNLKSGKKIKVDSGDSTASIEGSGDVHPTLNKSIKHLDNASATRNAFTPLKQKLGLANGTSNASGTDGRLLNDETSLVGEVAPEIWVHANSGTWDLVEQPQFLRLKRGDAIFNGQQTKDLLKQGYTSSFADGLSHMGGTAHVSSRVPISTTSSSSTKSTNPYRGVSTETSVDKLSKKFDSLSDKISIAQAKSELYFDYVNKNKQLYGFKTLDKYIKQYSKELATLQKRSDAGKYADKIRDLQKKLLELKKTVQEIAKTKFDNTVDYFDTLVATRDSRATMYDAKNDYYGMFKVNRQASKDAVKSQVSHMKDSISKQQEELKKAQKAYNTYSGRMNSKDKHEAYQKIKDIETKIYNDQKAYNELLQEQHKLDREAFTYRLTKLQQVANQYQNIINIAKAYDGLTTGTNVLSEKDYNNATNAQNKILDNYRQQKIKLQEEIKWAVSQGYSEASEYLSGLYNELSDVDSQITSVKTNIADLANDKVATLIVKPFEKIKNTLDQITKQISTLRGILGNENGFFDKNGVITGIGLTNISTYVSDYQNGLKAIQNDYDELNKLDQEFATNANYSAEQFAQDRASAVDNLQSDVGNVYSSMQNVISMMKNMGQQEIDALQKSIGKRKQALQAKKDYYDYDKTIKDQTKDISSLEAQIAALDGVTTVEAKAQKAKLQEQLADAKSDLEDTKQDHAYTLQTDGLDKIISDIQEQFDDTISEISSTPEKWKEVLENASSMVNGSQNVINSVVATISNLLGTNLKDAVSSALGTVMEGQNSTKTIGSLHDNAVQQDTLTTYKNDAQAVTTAQDALSVQITQAKAKLDKASATYKKSKTTANKTALNAAQSAYNSLFREGNQYYDNLLAANKKVNDDLNTIQSDAGLLKMFQDAGFTDITNQKRSSTNYALYGKNLDTAKATQKTKGDALVKAKSATKNAKTAYDKASKKDKAKKKAAYEKAVAVQKKAQTAYDNAVKATTTALQKFQNSQSQYKFTEAFLAATTKMISGLQEDAKTIATKANNSNNIQSTSLASAISQLPTADPSILSNSVNSNAVQTSSIYGGAQAISLSFDKMINIEGNVDEGVVEQLKNAEKDIVDKVVVQIGNELYNYGYR